MANSTVNKIVGVLQDAYDFWTGANPAQRGAPHRDWSVPQLAGYENHPFFPEMKEAFLKVPYAEHAADFVLRSNPAKGELDEASNPYTSAWIRQSAGIINLIPLTAAQTRLGTAHELGHNALAKHYRIARSATEVPASSIVIDSLAGKKIDFENMAELVNVAAGSNKVAMPKYNAEINRIIEATKGIPVDSTGVKRVWR